MKKRIAKNTAVVNILYVISLVIFIVLLFNQNVMASDNSTKIHFLTLGSGSDAIILESNGRYGMIDAGEDNDYPDGSNPRYPLRKGTMIQYGTEKQVMNFMENLGVTSDNFDFFIGTHAHSDHIGAADEIIRAFKPSKVYILEYDDSYITNAGALWDNQYVYDNMLIAAYDAGSDIILAFDDSLPADTIISRPFEESQPVSNEIRVSPYSSNSDFREPEKIYNGKTIISSKSNARNSSHLNLLEDIRKNAKISSTTICLGDMTLDFFNYDDNYKTTNIECANVMSLCIKLTASDHSTFLGGDLLKSEEPKIASLVGNVDIMKFNHHGLGTSNTRDFMNSLSPSLTIITGEYKNLQAETLSALTQLTSQFGTQLYSTAWYKNIYDSISINLKDLSTNITSEEKIITQTHSGLPVCYQNGYAYSGTEIVVYKNSSFLLLDSSYPVTNGWYAANSKWYYANSYGELQQGWIFDNSNYYYISSSYHMLTGWVSYYDNWYYLKSNGVMASNGWQLIDNVWYYFSSSGYAYRGGWQLINNAWYYFDYDCKMQTGWLTIGNQKYFLSNSGSMLTNWQYINGNWYYFNGSGALLTGHQTIDGITYYLDSTTGALIEMGWKFTNGNYYYYSSSDQYATGWQFINGSWYYFDLSGIMMSGWQDITGFRYYLGPSSSGAMSIGWRFLDGEWYYFNGSGAMVTGTYIVNGVKYFFDRQTGVMFCPGWKLLDGKYFYISTDGNTVIGWLLINNSWYYMNSEGIMLSGWQDIDNQRYHLGPPSSGAMLIGWQFIDQNWYYFYANGAMATGSILINNTVFYLDENGKWIP